MQLDEKRHTVTFDIEKGLVTITDKVDKSTLSMELEGLSMGLLIHLASFDEKLKQHIHTFKTK